MINSETARLELEAAVFRFQLQQVLMGRALEWISAKRGRAPPGERPAFVNPREFKLEVLANGNLFGRHWQQAGAEWRLYVCRDGSRFMFDAAMEEDLPPEALIEAAFQLVLARPADPAGQRHYGIFLQQADVGAMLRDLAGSEEAHQRGESLLIMRSRALPGGWPE